MDNIDGETQTDRQTLARSSQLTQLLVILCFSSLAIDEVGGVPFLVLEPVLQKLVACLVPTLCRSGYEHENRLCACTQTCNTKSGGKPGMYNEALFLTFWQFECLGMRLCIVRSI